MAPETIERILTTQGLAVLLVFVAIFLTSLWFVKVYVPRQIAILKHGACLGPQCQYRKDAEASSVTLSDLAHHPLWSFIQQSIVVKIPALPVSEKGRRRIAQRFLEIKFRAVRDSLIPLISRTDLVEMSNAELKQLFETAINNAILVYHAEAHAIGVPRVFMDRFDQIHHSAVETLFFQIELVCTSGWTEETTQKMAILLDDVRVALRNSLLNCEYTFGTINGQLDGYVFEGIEVQPIPGHKAKSWSRPTNPGLEPGGVK